MRDLRLFESHRMRAAELRVYGCTGDAFCGAFRFPSPIDGQPITVLASVGDGWDHVSVSRSHRCPNWPEMEFVKKKFFHDNEPAMQLHVPQGDHVNYHPNCLHMWRPLDQTIPMPPGWMVGPRNAEEEADQLRRMKGMAAT